MTFKQEMSQEGRGKAGEYFSSVSLTLIPADGVKEAFLSGKYFPFVHILFECLLSTRPWTECQVSQVNPVSPLFWGAHE